MTDRFIYGRHAIEAALKQSKRQILSLLIQQGGPEKRYAAILTAARKNQIPVQIVKETALDTLCHHQNHQGILAKIAPLPESQEKDLPTLLESLPPPYCLLILDGITDPHNLGACLRSADAAGVHAVILPKDNSASLNATVSKVASGATESVPVITVTNLSRTLSFLQAQGIWIYGADEEAKEDLWQIDLKGSIALVMGSEGKGLRRLTKESCDGLFSIPMLGQVASLNVSVATGISLFEVVRQRRI